MASYPSTLPIVVGYGVALEDGRRVDRATNGAARVRVLYTAAKRTFRIQHKAIDASELSTLLTFFSTNIAAEIAFADPIDSSSYTCVVSRPPQISPLGAGLFDVSLELEQV